MEAQAIAVEKPFVAAEAKFTELVTRLGTEESRRMTHSELESTCVPPRSRSRRRCGAPTKSSARTTAAALARS